MRRNSVNAWLARPLVAASLAVSTLHLAAAAAPDRISAGVSATGSMAADRTSC